MSCEVAYQARNRVVLKFITFGIGIFLNYAGYVVLLVLQSSINIKGGVGVATVTATYIAAALFSVTLTPILLRGLGAKICGVLCEFTYLVYILLNLYPAYFTLIPAGIIVGIGEATMWPVMILYSIHFAQCYAHHSRKRVEFYTTEFVGILYLTFNCSWVFGNLLNYAILFGGKSSISLDYNNSSTMMAPTVRDLSICGRNDCQDPNVTNQNLNRYEPASETLIYILIGVTAGLVVVAMLIQGCLVVNIGSDRKEEFSIVNDDNIQSENSNKQSLVKLMISTVKATAFHLITPKQLLLTPFALYCGLVLNFALSEVPRAFGSCVLNVDQVGLLTALCGGADALASLVSSKISSRFGTEVTMVLGFCHDIAFYMLCLFWIPTESSVWVIYIIFICSGISDGIWQPLVNGIHTTYFPGNLDIALSVWNLYVLSGIAWGAGWSTKLCVGTKIYFLLGFLCLSVLCYVISRFLHYGKSSGRMEEIN